MHKIFYLGLFGDSISFKENRSIRASGVNKMGYLAQCLSEMSFEVKIISPCWVEYNRDNGIKLFPSRRFFVNENVECVTPFGVSMPTKLFKVISMLLAKFWLIYYIIRYVNKTDKLIAYNSPFYFTTLLFLKRIKKFRLILEVEELYSEVFSMSNSWKKKEYKLISSADSFIFPNDLFYSCLNLKNKSYVVAYGAYKSNTQKYSSKFCDGKIHIVYAGSIDSLRKAAQMALQAAKFLNQNYILHILGFGEGQIIEDLKKEIEISNKTSLCKTFFEGMKINDELTSFLSSCHIGLNTQVLEEDYMKFAFPSKILSYLSSGLNVVSRKVNVINQSKVSDLITFYSNDSGFEIAETITKMKILESEDIKERLLKLDLEFKSSLSDLILET